MKYNLQKMRKSGRMTSVNDKVLYHNLNQSFTPPLLSMGEAGCCLHGDCVPHISNQGYVL